MNTLTAWELAVEVEGAEEALMENLLIGNLQGRREREARSWLEEALGSGESFVENKTLSILSENAMVTLVFLCKASLFISSPVFSCLGSEKLMESREENEQNRREYTVCHRSEATLIYTSFIMWTACRSSNNFFPFHFP